MAPPQRWATGPSLLDNRPQLPYLQGGTFRGWLWSPNFSIFLLPVPICIASNHSASRVTSRNQIKRIADCLSLLLDHANASSIRYAAFLVKWYRVSRKFGHFWDDTFSTHSLPLPSITCWPALSFVARASRTWAMAFAQALPLFP